MANPTEPAGLLGGLGVVLFVSSIRLGPLVGHGIAYLAGWSSRSNVFELILSLFFLVAGLALLILTTARKRRQDAERR